MTTETDNTEQPIFCGKCRKPHGTLKFDGQVFEVGNVQFFNSVRYSCVCGRAKSFIPSPIADSTKGFTDEAGTILNGLGLNKKYKGLRMPRKKTPQEN